MVSSRRLGLVVLGLLAFVAGRPLSASPARLTAPGDGAVLTSGSLAEVAWEEVALPAHAEEWEAFLSLDGGRSYPLRITPHLDLGLRRFWFEVPPYPSRDARILLRFGDEGAQESEIEAPHRFAIALGDLPILLPRLPAYGLGESARPGEAGVVAWVEGDRTGHGLRQVVGGGTAAALASVEPSGTFGFGFAAPRTPRPSVAPPTSMPLPSRAKPTVRAARSAHASDAPGTSVRLLISRFNE